MRLHFARNCQHCQIPSAICQAGCQPRLDDSCAGPDANGPRKDPAFEIKGLPHSNDWMAEVADFADTAAIIANLDVVVSVDTSVVHLAGAMGKPVLMLDRYDSCWRWLSGREDSPWYPTLRILRQETSGDWAPVTARAAALLAEMRDAV